jgi:hypothetical protein
MQTALPTKIGNPRQHHRRPRPEVIFEPVEMKIGKGWYVLATPPKGTAAQLGGFKTEDEAREWIKRKSIAWLKEFEGGKYT